MLVNIGSVKMGAPPMQARLEMLSGISTLLAALPGVFDTDDMRGVFTWLEKFVRNPWSNDDANVYGGELSFVCSFHGVVHLDKQEHDHIRPC